VEERLHLHAIERLARELDLPQEDVRALYEEVLGRIRQEARIRDYLVVLVSHQVKDLIQSQDLRIELTQPRRDLPGDDFHTADTGDSARMAA
jgi:hypothetical protein